MGRAGGGSRSGGRRSSGSHSRSRSSGGHRIRSSSRSGSSFSSSRGSSYSYGGSGFGGYHTRSIHRTSNGGIIRFSSASPATIFLIVIMVLIVLCIAWTSTSVQVPSSTTNREKISGVTWQNDCIVDELGWFDNISRTSRELQYFYNETGVQPYIVLKEYDPTLQRDDDKIFYAEQWYDEHIDNEGTFLYMYFAEEDADNDVGYMCYVNGREISTVMDAEAIDIFWAYLDNKWYSDMSTDDLFVYVFDKTADRIMSKSITGSDIMMVLVCGGIAVAVIFITHKALKAKYARDKEKAQETERILNTPLEKLETDADILVDKYTDK